MPADQFDIAVIGAGVAGMTAAIGARKPGLKVALFEAEMFGGMVTNINHLKPVPAGLPESGSDLAAELMAEIADLDIEVVMEPVAALSQAPSGAIEVTAGDQTLRARTAIVASGARHRGLGVPGEEGYENRGLSHCADCDGPLFAGAAVVVVGGGDSALQEAAVLAEVCAAVHLVHRGDSFSARDAFVAAVRRSDRIEVHFGTVVEAIAGEEGVEGVRLRNLETGETRDLACKGIFPFIGLTPNTAFLPSSVAMTEGAVRVDANLESSLPNVFAVGAARAGHGGEITDAIRDAEAAVDVICARHAPA